MLRTASSAMGLFATGLCSDRRIATFSGNLERAGVGGGCNGCGRRRSGAHGGASGQLGQKILKELQARAQGHEIIAISRSPENASAGVEGRFGDYDEPGTLVQAYAGLDRLVLIPTSDPRPGQRSQQNVAAIDAAQKAGVKHLVFVSAAGVRELAEPHMNASFWVGEQHLMKAGIKWTILRKNFYAESFALQAKMALPGGVVAGVAENKVAFVSRDDVAAAAAGILIGERHEGAIYNATGPEAISGAQRAAIVAEVTGQPLRFATLAPEQLRDALEKAGLAPPLANRVLRE